MTGKCGLCKIDDREVRLWILVFPADGAPFIDFPLVAGRIGRYSVCLTGEVRLKLQSRDREVLAR